MSDWYGPVTWMEADGSQGTLAGDELVERARQITGDDANPDGAFVRAIRSGGPAWPDFAIGAEAQAIADAVYRSAAAGGAVVDVR